MVLSTLDSAHIWFCLLGIMFMKEYFYLRSFCPSRIVFTIDTINCGFCSRLALCSWESVQLGGCLLEFCLFWLLFTWNQFTWESCHMTICPSRMCPLLVLSTLLSAHVWFCLLGNLSNWVFVILDFVHFRVRPYDILSK